jgi:cob(I)alamin adenosyltransferase
MSIATKRGDSGQTGLVGDVRVSKGDQRVEAYGSVDELNSVLGFARSICQNAAVCSWTETIQKTLFRLGAALATEPETEKKKAEPSMTSADVDELTNLVHKIEATPDILSDWSLPGAHTEASAFEISRTVCRRAERQVVRLMESGGFVDPQVLAYLNRLSDLLWLFGRLLEAQAGIDSKLRDDTHKSTRWSKAW